MPRVALAFMATETAESAPSAFKAKQKVVASVDLPGVPAGTRGKVMMRTGFSWIRYRVRFENEVEVPWLDDRHLVSLKSYKAEEAHEGEQ